MKILYLNKIEANAGWGAETFLRDALESEGVATECVDYQVNEFRIAEAVAEVGEDCDAVLVQRGCGYLFPAEVLRALRRPKVLLFTELVARNRDQDPLLGSGCFDHVFVRTEACRQFMIEKGWLAADRCSLALSACPGLYLDEQGEVEKDIDVLWVGTILGRRRELLDRIGERFAVTEAQAFGAAMADLVRRSKIVLNLHGEEWLDTETRVYEVLGSGGFLLSERLSEESPFRNGEHLVEAGDVDELIDRIGEFLEKSGERERIGKAGREAVMRDHSYAARAKQIAEVLSKVIGEGGPEGPLVDETLLAKAADRERSLGRRSRAKEWLKTAAKKAVGVER